MNCLPWWITIRLKECQSFFKARICIHASVAGVISHTFLKTFFFKSSTWYVSYATNTWFQPVLQTLSFIIEKCSIKNKGIWIYMIYPPSKPLKCKIKCKWKSISKIVRTGRHRKMLIIHALLYQCSFRLA